MAESQFVKKIKAACHRNSIESKSWLHFGRKTAPALMDLEEVSELDKRALGNWATDVFGEVYSSKLPLAAMRVMAGFDKRSGMHHNPRTTFYGDSTHAALAKKIFPWIEEVLEESDLTDKPTARGFLNYLINLRWVILQDCAVLIGKNKRKHFIFEHMSEIFDSETFKDFTAKMMEHLDEQAENSPDKAKLDIVLPGVNQRLDDNKHATSNMHKDLKGDLQTVIAHNIEVSMNKIEDTVKNTVNSTFAKLGRCMATLDSKGDDEDMEDNLNTAEEEPSPSPPSQPSPSIATPMRDGLYSVPSKFISVQSMVVHWETYAKEMEKANGHKWRHHLTKSDTKRFTRMKRIVTAFKKEVTKGLMDTVQVYEVFETFYSKNKRSIAKLADVFVKSLSI